MDFSPQQQSALDALGAWADAPLTDEHDLVRYMAGFAGTGKTTLAKHLASYARGTVLFAAYTGKAAYVMRSKGCVGATTIHSLIYKPAGESKSDQLQKIEKQLADLWSEPPEDDQDRTRRQIEEKALQAQRDRLLVTERRRPMFTLNWNSDLRAAKLLVLDECSMVDEVIGRDLESFGVKILALGDPAQLPPVAAGGHYTARRPDVLLTEVHRQAKESGILRAATDVREGRGLTMTPGHYGEDCVVAQKGRTDADVMRKRVVECDQVLVGKNETRHMYNARLRQLTGKDDPFPLAGDKVVCLRNNHDAGLLNGSLWRVHESVNDPSAMTCDMVVSSEEDGLNGVTATSWAHHFLGQEAELKKMQWSRKDFEEFDYGYALTVHKSQGSQWDDVVLFDESTVFRDNAARWLYTGLTRAAKSVTVYR
jgi:exodeoxyribonuclease-5